MGADAYPLRGNIAELRLEVVAMEGTGAAVPTKLYGPGITITRTSEGLYKFTWASSPGVFIGMLQGLGAASPAAMAGFTLSHDTYDATTRTIEVLLSEADNSVVDLADNQFETLGFLFKQTAV